MALSDIYKASCIFDHPNADGALVVTSHWELDIVTTALSEPGFCAELASQLRTVWENGYLPLISSGYTFVRVDTYNVTQPQYQGTFASGNNGAVAGDLMALRNAPVVARKSGLRGRRSNGRMYLLAPLETQQAAGVLDSTFQTALQTWLDANLLTVVTGNSNEYKAMIYSKKFLVANEVSTYTVRGILGSQRGRQEVA